MNRHLYFGESLGKTKTFLGQVGMNFQEQIQHERIIAFNKHPLPFYTKGSGMACLYKQMRDFDEASESDKEKCLRELAQIIVTANRIAEDLYA